VPCPGRSLTLLQSTLILDANLPDPPTRDSIDASNSLIGVNWTFAAGTRHAEHVSVHGFVA
jgi:hypothetical protein